MESLKHPGTIIAGVDALAIIGLAVWTHRQLKEVREDLDLHGAKSDKIAGELKESFPKLVGGLRAAGEEIRSQTSSTKKLEKRYQSLEERLNSIDDQLGALMDLLVEKATVTSAEMEKVAAPLAPKGFRGRAISRRAKKRSDDSDDSNDESETGSEVDTSRGRSTTRARSARARRDDDDDDDVSKAVAAARGSTRPASR